VAADGGYRVTGTTPFVSGAHQAKWYLGLANIYDGDAPRLGPEGHPVTLITACPAREAVLVDNWRTLGMRGTGSHDISMTDVFVPSHRTAVLASYEQPGSAYQGPLYKFTVWVAISVLAPVPLGIARAAIDELLALATKKTPSYLAKSLAERSSVQAVVGEAEARLGAARAYLYEALTGVWEKALQGHLIDMPGKMKLQLAATHAVVESARVVDLVHSAAGTTAIREEHSLQRHFRDVHTITQHAFVSASRYESGGQYFLGVPIEWPFYGL
jgi:alkylation response protein AidB-like acyl-CoA dehydrogenase